MKNSEEKRRAKVLARRGYVLDMDEAWHLSFTDIPLYSPLLGMVNSDPRSIHHAINTASLHFMDQYLKGGKAFVESFKSSSGIRLRRVGSELE
ncbi:hypothetical protein G8C92_29700 [Paenibacillus donghaensis]|uniref:hypothetical protein n=1 Tax=Paenibacillus donghaensis TaxID=414771 RepID=UPI0018846E68|nr:hypothetical protein [Paenibacillus donghaensis]MBE9918176.1 hypothetical protein [Paenibacillus donghaensis]